MWHISNIHIIYISIITNKSFEQSNAFSKSYNYIMRNLVFNKILSWNQSSSFLSGYSNLCCSMLSSSQVLLNEFNLAKKLHIFPSPPKGENVHFSSGKGGRWSIYISYIPVYNNIDLTCNQSLELRWGTVQVQGLRSRGTRGQPYPHSTSYHQP